jgi:chromate transporter
MARMTNPASTAPVPFAEAVAVWWRIGLLSFGGPAAQIALLHRIVVDEKRWLDEARFLHALNYCMLLPGPEAQQLATYTGWLLHGVRGGLVAGVLFILPGAAAIMALSWLYVLLGDLQPVVGVFFGLKAAVLAIVVQALLRVASRALHGVLGPVLAAGAFVALFVFDLPFPLVVVGAGIVGYLHGRAKAADPAPEVGADLTLRPHTRSAALACLLLWGATVGGVYLLAGPDSVFTQIAQFFSYMAVVTFGGAYAVLAFVAQQGVEQYGWLQAGEMQDGLGLAETTPGPLILVTQFVGFLAAFRQAELGSALAAATLGAALTTWVTFLPCFLWIFAGAPYVERLRGHRPLAAALSAITAAVVGVIANLALWFALNSLFREQSRVTGWGLDLLVPDLSSLDIGMLALSVLAFVLVFALRLGILPVIGLCAAGGVALTVL